MKTIKRIVRQATHYYKGENPLEYLTSWYAKRGYLVLDHALIEGGKREEYVRPLDDAVRLCMIFLGKNRVKDKALTSRLLQNYSEDTVILLSSS